jgi:hypothetical protein
MVKLNEEVRWSKRKDTMHYISHQFEDYINKREW